MLRKLPYAIMLLPILTAGFLTFSATPTHAVPVHTLVAFDVPAEPEPSYEAAPAVEVALAGDAEDAGQ